MASSRARIASVENKLGGERIHIFEYLSASEQANATARSGVDCTSAFSSLASQIPSTGAQIVLPPGKFDCTTGATFTAPVFFNGAGSDPITYANAGARGGTTITCSSNTATLFTVNGAVARFAHLSLVDTAPSRLAGSGIFATSSNAGQRTDFDDIRISGFYDSLDVGVGNSWSLYRSIIEDTRHWGFRVRNTVLADAGDWEVIGTKFYPANGAAAAIRWEGSGNGKIIANSMVPQNNSFVDGISMDTTNNASIQMFIALNKIERVTGTPINIAKGYSPAIITNNILHTDSATAPAIALGLINGGVVAHNTLQGGGGQYAITTDTCPNLKVGPNSWTGFTSEVGMLDTTCTYYGATGFQLLNGSGVPTMSAPNGSVYFRTDGTSTTTLYVRVGGSWVAR